MNQLKIILLVASVVFAMSCKNKEENTVEAEEVDQMIRLGGDVTRFDVSPNAFGFRSPNLSNQQEQDFFIGNSFFNQNWVAAPASTTARDGLGPFFNATSCASCHFKDGRGHSPDFNGQKNHGLLLRLSSLEKNSKGEYLPHSIYGGQLQDQSISGVKSEGEFEITYQNIGGKYDDGVSYSLRKPIYSFQNMNYGEMGDVLVSPRVAPQMIGMGLLEAISEEDILNNEDENDANNDGISGKANYVWDLVNNKISLGRFGWKANQPSLLQQTAGAFLGDMGITSYLFPEQDCNDCDTLANGGLQEIEKVDLDKVVFYSSTLAVPARRNYDDEKVKKGKELFVDLACNSCHIMDFVTGNHPISELSNQKIHPFTDLLLHDMGTELADNTPDGLANGKEWRTPPLWGIGLIETVNNHTELLHDGRARNIEEAIIWHGGESLASQKKFLELNIDDRNALLAFLNSL